MFNLFLGTYHPGTQYLLPGDYLVMTRQSSNSLWVQVRAGSGNPRRSRAGEVTWSISFSLWTFWAKKVFKIKSPQQLQAPVKPTCWGGSSCGTSWDSLCPRNIFLPWEIHFVPEIYSWNMFLPYCHCPRNTFNRKELQIFVKGAKKNQEHIKVYPKKLVWDWQFHNVKLVGHFLLELNIVHFVQFSYEDKSIWDWQFHNKEWATFYWSYTFYLQIKSWTPVKSGPLFKSTLQSVFDLNIMVELLARIVAAKRMRAEWRKSSW